MAVSRRLRFEILRRDAHTCRYCGGKAPDVPLQVDHVIPVSLGGSDDPSNLVTACADCNRGKASVPADAVTVDDVAKEALIWATAFKANLQQKCEDLKQEHTQVECFDDFWKRWRLNADDGEAPRPWNWQYSVRRWLRMGVPTFLLVRLIDEAMTVPKVQPDALWRYYCGMVWTTVRQSQEVVAAEQGA